MFFKKSMKKSGNHENQSAYIGPATVCDGVLTFSGEMYVDGIVNGEIQSDGTLVLGKEGRITGTVNVNELYCDGSMEGEISVQAKAVLYKNAHLDGSLNTLYLSVEEGATVDGMVKAQNKSGVSYGKVLEISDVDAKTDADPKAEDDFKTAATG